MHGKLGKTMQKSHLIQKEGNSFEFLSSPNNEVLYQGSGHYIINEKFQ